MSDPSPCIKSLYDFSLKELCRSMNEKILEHLLNSYQPSIVLEVVWKVRINIILIRNYPLLGDKNVGLYFLVFAN